MEHEGLLEGRRDLPHQPGTHHVVVVRVLRLESRLAFLKLALEVLHLLALLHLLCLRLRHLLGFVAGRGAHVVVVTLKRLGLRGALGLLGERGGPTLEQLRHELHLGTQFGNGLLIGGALGFQGPLGRTVASGQATNAFMEIAGRNRRIIGRVGLVRIPWGLSLPRGGWFGW
jgi:hypothetical protein